MLVLGKVLVPVWPSLALFLLTHHVATLCPSVPLAYAFHIQQISALPPFEPRRTLEGLLDPRELWSTLKAAAFAARGWLGTNPWKALTGAYTSGTLTKLDVRAWSKILAANLEPVADVYPGRWRRCVPGSVMILLDRGQWDTASQQLPRACNHNTAVHSPSSHTDQLTMANG
jgi:hypothetical protein